MEPINSVVDFLLQNPVDNLTKEVIVSERLKDYPFVIKAMTGPEHQRYQEVALMLGKKNKINFDNKKFNELVIQNQVITPSFKSEENLSKANCISPEEFIYKFLLSGEIVELVKQISEFSGFDMDEEELIDQVKNG